MSYKLVFTERSIKDLKKLDSDVKSRIANKLKIYSKNPEQYAKKLISPLIGSYRFRIGKYRVIFDIDGDKIVILRIGHRKWIYRS
jgi:mRNA interferase RelE/StbE